MSRPLALITGAGSGIGRGLAQALAADAWQLLVTDIDGDAAEAVAADIRAHGAVARAAQLDVTCMAQIEQVIAQAAQPVALLINNAGLQHLAPLEDFGVERFSRMIDIMLTGAARVAAAVLPGMRSAGHGRIIGMGSIHSLVASPYKSAYVAAKHGLVGLTRTLALETASTDITVNLICPAYVRTPMVTQQLEAQASLRGLSVDAVAQQVMLQPMPKQRFVEIEEIAATVRFLASNAARNITGQCITIDGGWTAQ